MKALGDDYETRAAQWLQGRGLQLLARNYRGKTGEIDIVAKDKNTLVFVEVRARNNRYFASAAASVDKRKQLRILRTAQLYLQHHPGMANMPCRFDVIAFEPRQSVTSPEIHWIRNAFTA
ncbi:MAG: YraN family protein [Gammaproteobacteria bacterium]|nr:MAG: YraN family protein [Gammaproteobacteria bacterium]RLA58164.1 MAG: YraN family protein [Gammaproteobacteria bacterium]